MKLARFEDWFGVRANHQDDDIWPSRIIYDPKDGIEMTTINFASADLWYSNPTFEAGTITGYLDYQRPATLIKPFIQSAKPGSIGRDTPFIRASYDVAANGLLKNFHLQDLSYKCFTGFRVQLPSFHAWMAPQLVRKKWNVAGSVPVPSIIIADHERENINLDNGIEVEILRHSSVTEIDEELPVRQHTTFSLKFLSPVDYESLLQMTWSFETIFSFLVGRRLESAVYYLPTIETRKWNETEQSIVAESWIVPAWKRDLSPPHWRRRMFVKNSCPVGLTNLLEFCFSQNNDSLIYFMNMVLAAEMHDLKPDDCFIEILGCLEDFDKTQFGSGSDPEIRRIRRKIQRTVDKYGDEEERAVCAEIGKRVRNEYSLRQRLERLFKLWGDDGFRGSPDISRIVQLRNIKPHGRGRDFSLEDFREVTTLLPILSALFRYHILKVLGFDRKSIAEGFARIPHRFGAFVPTASPEV